ncbi:peroxide stress protein YaaA [Flintibacter sp. KGMB00164]|jgi:cytoplasmic iron level regulating protein YaaA (DUF328/UPF0246 family)|uniref:peroxide stress protein YaaA n=1 Tax=Flintibacter sp. KGMB00164 TaxID=2610895 RepID=UPI001FA9BB2E|nr:peroxide stress protein YaaA [Flintibacter sp. KGMB00164]
MQIIISPAKKMVEDRDSLAPRSVPQFLPQTRQLLKVLRAMSPQELQSLWSCNDAIARLNVQRLETMELEGDLTPAILSYQGIQYQYMAPGVLESQALDYLQAHLRILSGFYGVLRPFDGVTPYRLEMQAKLAVERAKNLYEFWGNRLAQTLAEEGDWVLNLASKEYSRAVAPHLPHGTELITCRFGIWKGGKLAERGTQCKMARGEMVRWLAQNQITRQEDLPAFQGLGYRFDPSASTPTELIFYTEGE